MLLELYGWGWGMSRRRCAFGNSGLESLVVPAGIGTVAPCGDVRWGDGVEGSAAGSRVLEGGQRHCEEVLCHEEQP